MVGGGGGKNETAAVTMRGTPGEEETRVADSESVTVTEGGKATLFDGSVRRV